MLAERGHEMAGVAKSGFPGDACDGEFRVPGEPLLGFVNAHLDEVGIRGKSKSKLEQLAQMAAGNAEYFGQTVQTDIRIAIMVFHPLQQGASFSTLRVTETLLACPNLLKRPRNR